ncbi:MAG TPA: hypothetical protein PKC22_13180 [Rhodocyclaceae bacterium]|nr:hypothetical protein [Rhodocyclaceae bacterium]
MKKLMTALLSLTALAWASRKLMKRFPPEQAAADQGATGHVLAIADANADGVLTLDAAGRIEAADGVVRTRRVFLLRSWADSGRLAVAKVT